MHESLTAETLSPMNGWRNYEDLDERIADLDDRIDELSTRIDHLETCIDRNFGPDMYGDFVEGVGSMRLELDNLERRRGMLEYDL